MVSELRFDWDPRKAIANLQKHRISFEEAQTAFLDEDALVIEDPDHSEEEDRFILLGTQRGSPGAIRLPLRARDWFADPDHQRATRQPS